MTDLPPMDEHIYALVADVEHDPGACVVRRLASRTPTGFMALDVEAVDEDDAAPLARAQVITRSHDLDRIMLLKTMLDDAWASSGESMRTHIARSEDIRQQYAGRTNIDVDGLVAALKRNAKSQRIALWSHVVKALASVPICPELPSDAPEMPG